MKIKSFTFPTFKFPTITMPWTKQINEMKKQIAELEYELGELSSRIAEVDEGVDKRFDNLNFIDRNEVESMIEDCVEETINEIDIDEQVTQALRSATFEVAVHV